MRISLNKKECDTIARLGRWILFCGVILFGFLGFLWWKAITVPKEHLVLFFDSSVNGLSVGSPVKVQGITVGQVELLDVRLPRAASQEFYAAVQVTLFDRELAAKGMPGNLSELDVLREEITRGLRGKLALLSPMTGEFYVELNYSPELPPVLVSSPEEKLAEIPTLPKAFSVERLDTYAERLVKFSQNDFSKLEGEWQAVLDSLLEETEPERLRAANAEILQRLEKARVLLTDPALQEECRRINADMARLRRTLEDNGSSVVEQIEESAKALVSLQQSLMRVNSQAMDIAATLDLKSPQSRRLQKYLVGLRNALNSMIANFDLPIRLAFPVPVNSSGLSPAGQSED